MILTIEAEVFEQHALEAAMLWSTRDAAARDAAHDLASLSNLDERVEANLDGLRLADNAGVACARAALDGGEDGEVFVATILAVERGDLRAVAHVLDLVGEDPALGRGVVGALGWVGLEHVQRILAGLLDGRCPPSLHYLGIAACAAHRHDPGAALGYAAVAADPRLKACALAAAGELGRSDLLPELRAELGAADESCRFAAAWAGAILGDPAAARALSEIAAGGGEHAAAACDLAMRHADPASAPAFLEHLARDPRGRPAAIAGAAALGDPAAAPWLLELMQDPPSARGAGAAFTAITGVDLAGDKLAGKAPEGFRAGPSDDPADPDVAMDPDESLPWPEAAALRGFWAREGGRFKRGTRYLLGQPMTPAWLHRVLRTGNQAIRAGVAVELCLREPRRPLFAVRAPAFRQRRELAGS